MQLDSGALAEEPLWRAHLRALRYGLLWKTMRKIAQPGVHEHKAARIYNSCNSASQTILEKFSREAVRQGMLLHEWIEQWIVKRLERLKSLDWFRRPDQYSDSGTLARNTVAICAVADE